MSAAFERFRSAIDKSKYECRMSAVSRNVMEIAILRDGDVVIVENCHHSGIDDTFSYYSVLIESELL